MSEVKSNPRIIKRLDNVNDEVKQLAMNLAMFLSEKKNSSQKLSVLEPECINMINSTIKAAQEISHILNTAANNPDPEFQTDNDIKKAEELEHRLHMLLTQCQQMLEKLLSFNEVVAQDVNTEI